MIDVINPAAAVSETPLSSGVDSIASRRVSPGAAVQAPQADFGAMLSQLASNAVGAVKTAEAMSIAGVKGQASIHQVVEAVMSAEQALHSAMAVRDKVVGAYMEISRMQI
jgi:flagellar hook-basal body complex protein FliE